MPKPFKNVNSDVRWLILLVGLPYSGKTTWALKTGFPIVGRDAIRLALHGQRYIAKAEEFVSYLEFKMVESLFMAGHQYVILDSMNLKEKYRSRWQRDDCIWHVCLKVIETPYDVCIDRAKKADDDEIIPVIEKNKLLETTEAEQKDYYAIYQDGQTPIGFNQV